MGRYWSLEECCWVEYTATTDLPAASTAEQEPPVSEQIPEQLSGTPQQAPSVV